MDGAAADVDDTAGAARFHRFDEGLGDLHGDAHVQVQHVVEGGQVDLAQRLGRGDADVVDHGIDREFLADLAQHFLGAAGVGQVTGIEVAGKVHIAGIARDTDHMTTHVGQPLSKGPAYAFGGARDEHAFVLHGSKPRCSLLGRKRALGRPVFK
ncbi:hypothetical protein MyNCGM683_50090 [Achromobacter xylosoxidans]